MTGAALRLLHHTIMLKQAIPLLLTLAAVPAWADPPEVVAVRAAQQGTAWRFDVTLRHPDTGWDHYADGWEVLAPDGTQLGLRVLAHPHEHEQPFTRSLSGVVVPDDVQSVFVRARCIVDGWSEDLIEVPLP